MNIVRFLYIEMKSNGVDAVNAFETKAEAVSFASIRLKEVISETMGENYRIPSEDIDEDGNIYHSTGDVEIESSELGWSFCRGFCEMMGASIDEQTIELTSAEMLNLYDAQVRVFLLEDAERQLMDYVDYSCLDAAHDDFDSAFGFSLNEAVDCSSEHYLLDRIVDRFTDKFDCNVAENDLWFEAIEDVLMSTEVKCPSAVS